MINLQDQLFVKLKLGDVTVTDNTLGLKALLIHSGISTKHKLPLLEMVLSDPYNLINVNNGIPLIDGLPIVLTVGKTSQDAKTYSFRLFRPQKYSDGTAFCYKITGYLDAPKYMFDSSGQMISGSSSTVLSTIASQCKLSFNGVNTSDSQNWYQGNMNYATFVQFVASHGYLSDNSLMVTAVTDAGVLKYLDWNNLTDTKNVFSYNPADANGIILSQHLVYQISGFGNALRGYRNRLVEQVIDNNNNYNIYRDVQIKQTPGNTHINLNSDIRSEVLSGRVDFTPLVATGGSQVHAAYNKAHYQNIRGGMLQANKVRVLTYLQNDLSILDVVNCHLAANLGTADSQQNIQDNSHDGRYTITEKQIVVKPPHYSEVYMLTRNGINTSAA